jgi:hypothetical protein
LLPSEEASAAELACAVARFPLCCRCRPAIAPGWRQGVA